MMIDDTTRSRFFCNHAKIRQVHATNSMSLVCLKCKGTLTEFRTDIEEAKNFDKMIARRLYVFGAIHKLTEEKLKRWV